MAKSLTPVYLPRLKKDDDDPEMYNVSVTQNEENLNQNLDYLFRQILKLQTQLGGDDSDG